MTLAEKLLAARTGRKSVSPGEFLSVPVDLILANDLTAPLAIQEFRRLGVGRVFDPKKVVLVPDHFVPAKDIASAEGSRVMREFAKEQGAVYFEVGRAGIEHALLPDKGLVHPGQIIIGADSHTCTYGALGAFATGMGSTDVACAMATGDTWMKVPHTIRFLYHGRLPKWVGGKDLILFTIGQIGVDGALYASMEFDGHAIKEMSMDGRFTMANMAVEAGAKTGLFAVDEKTLEYLRARVKGPFQVHTSEGPYSRVMEYDVSALEPQVAFPHLPGNSRPLSQVGNVELDQAVIGSCTNGRMEDLRTAAHILKGRKAHPRVRLVVIPATQDIYLQASKEGLLEVFVLAGAAVSTPTCGPCLGGYMGVLAEGERAIATTNRNFRGRMGSPKSEVYLASPAVVAASAVLGRIAGPGELGL